MGGGPEYCLVPIKAGNSLFGVGVVPSSSWFDWIAETTIHAIAATLITSKPIVAALLKSFLLARATRRLSLLVLCFPAINSPPSHDQIFQIIRTSVA
jgi:hypothetical protein